MELLYADEAVVVCIKPARVLSTVRFAIVKIINPRMGVYLSLQRLFTNR